MATKNTQVNLNLDSAPSSRRSQEMQISLKETASANILFSKHYYYYMSNKLKLWSDHHIPRRISWISFESATDSLISICHDICNFWAFRKWMELVCICLMTVVVCYGTCQPLAPKMLDVTWKFRWYLTGSFSVLWKNIQPKLLQQQSSKTKNLKKRKEKQRTTTSRRFYKKKKRDFLISLFLFHF